MCCAGSRPCTPWASPGLPHSSVASRCVHVHVLGWTRGGVHMRDVCVLCMGLAARMSPRCLLSSWPSNAQCYRDKLVETGLAYAGSTGRRLHAGEGSGSRAGHVVGGRLGSGEDDGEGEVGWGSEGSLAISSRQAEGRSVGHRSLAASSSRGGGGDGPGAEATGGTVPKGPPLLLVTGALLDV